MTEVILFLELMIAVGLIVLAVFLCPSDAPSFPALPNAERIVRSGAIKSR